MLIHDLNRSILKDPEHCVINEREERSAYTAKELDT
jgi:hypothetical protein